MNFESKDQLMDVCASFRGGETKKTAWLMLAGQMLLWIGAVAALGHGEEPSPANDEAARRATAVALNYSRASLHRIRKNPTLAVLTEEQEKILNNLNLGAITDGDVLKLYSTILDEMTQVQITAREHGVLKDRYDRQIRQGLSSTGFVLAAQIASAQFGSAAKTGAGSWWDYRNTSVTRDLELWKLEKQRVLSFVQKSSQFLDTTWKLAHDRNIPDRWLVRGNDLDALDAAMQEKDPEVRLRILRRMEPFMECYPPYWYYKGRTQQGLEQWDDAIATYAHLQQIADGHFRRDEMLAAALANRGVVLEALGRPEAVDAARTALRYSTDVWEANVLCARILERHQQYGEAEDAILRNLDVNLETQQSTVFLVSLYYQTANHEKLAKRLADREVVQHVPGPVLLQCAAALGAERTPVALRDHLTASLQLIPRYRFGKDDLLVAAGRDWQLEHSVLTLHLGDRTFRQQDVRVTKDLVYVRFAEAFEGGSPLGEPTALDGARLDVRFPGIEPMELAFNMGGAEQATSYRGNEPALFAASPNTNRQLRLAGVSLKESRTTSAENAEVVADATPEPAPALAAQSTGQAQPPTAQIVDVTPVQELESTTRPASLRKVEELESPPAVQSNRPLSLEPTEVPPLIEKAVDVQETAAN